MSTWDLPVKSGALPPVGRHANSAPLQADIPSLAETASLDGRKLLAMHGTGPKALRILKSAAAGSGLTYAAGVRALVR